MGEHLCHAHGCTEPVPPKMFSCRPHWYALPKVLRDAVWREFRAGQETDKRPTRRYIAVQRLAVAHLAFKPGDAKAAKAVAYYLEHGQQWRERAIKAGEGDPWAGLPHPAASSTDAKPEPLLALTLDRPWPFVIGHLPPKEAKGVENRRWPMPAWVKGKQIALHAGKSFDLDAVRRFRAGAFGEAARSCPAVPNAHPTGIVGVWTFKDCVAIGDIDLNNPAEACWSFGPWVWRIASVHMLATPVPCSGRQKVWQVPTDIAAQVRQQLAGVVADGPRAAAGA